MQQHPEKIVLRISKTELVRAVQDSVEHATGTHVSTADVTQMLLGALARACDDEHASDLADWIARQEAPAERPSSYDGQ